MASLEDVQVDMRVVDASGQEVGTVEEVKMGDPEAVTAEGQTQEAATDVAEYLRGAFRGSDLKPEHADRLLRLGYIKVDSKGLFTANPYVASDDITEVADQVVHLGIDLSARR